MMRERDCIFCSESTFPGTLVGVEMRKNLEELTGIQFNASGYSCENCLHDLSCGITIRNRFKQRIKILNTLEECKIQEVPGSLEEDYWLKLPPEIWVEIMGYLNREDLNSMHLVCNKTHAILNEHFDHKMDLYSTDAEKLEFLRRSSRRYEEATIRMSAETSIKELQCVFQDVGIYLKKLKLDNMYSGEGFDDARNFIKLLPNLEWLKLRGFRKKKTQSKEPLKLSKLKCLKTLACHNSILGVFGECKIIEEVKIKVMLEENNPAFIEKFILLNQKSLKKVALCGSNGTDFSFCFFGLDDIKLESLILKNLRVVNTRHLQEFLQTQAETLKTLECQSLDVLDQQFLDFVSEKLQKLEVLEIYGSLNCNIDEFHGFNQLKRLRKLRIDQFEVLHGLCREVTENLEDLDVPIDDNIQLANSILDDLRICLPNLKKLTIPLLQNYTIECLLLNFGNLEHLVIKDTEDANNLIHILGSIATGEIDCEMLKKISVLSDRPECHFRHGKLTLEY